MNKHKSFSAFIIIVMVAMAFGTPLTASAQEPSPVKVGLVSDEAGANDMSFNWMAYQGLQQAEADLGVDGTLYEFDSGDDYVPLLQQCVDDGNALCIAVGFRLEEAIVVVADANPGTSFAILDPGMESSLTNLRLIHFDEKQAGYLAGALAGKMTGTNVIGAVAGMGIPPVVAFAEGYRNGAQCANPDVNVLIDYAGSFTDYELGVASAQGMIAQGADTLFAIAGATGDGGIAYGTQHGTWGIGIDADQYLSLFGNGTVTGSDKLLTSAMKNLDFAVYQTVLDYTDGSFSSGTVTYHLADGGVGLAPYHGADASIPQSAEDYVAGVKAGIINGSVNIDETCRAEPQPDPSFTALFPWNRIDAYRWPMDVELTLTIDDPDNGTNVDYTETITVGMENFNPPSDTWASFEVEGFELQPGQLMSVTDGTTIKTHEVQYVTVTEVNPQTDTITGTATPGVEVQIGRMCDESGCAYREIIANAEGNWTADLTSLGNVGGVQGVFDIRPGSRSDAFVADDDDDRTSYQWDVPSPPDPPTPSVDIDVYNNSAYASDWPAGAEVAIYFDIPGNGIEWDYSETAIAPVWDGGGWCQFVFDIDPADFRIAAGQVVRITDGTTARQAIIPDVQVTGEDPTADTIRGTAPAGSTVDLAAVFWSGGSGNFRRHAIADNSGNWLADFAHTGVGDDEQTTFDVIPGTGFFWVSQPISYSVGIKFMWDFGPYFHVFPEQGRVETYVWPRGADLTLTIDNPVTPENPDLTRTQENLAWQTDFEDLGTILPGFTVSITGGLVTKTHTVTDLDMTGADAEMDTVAGTAGSDGMLEVRVCGEKCWVSRHVSAGGADHGWLADFHVPGQGNDEQDVLDLSAGNDIDVWQADIDGDATTLQGRVPNPPTFSALPDEDSIEGNDWPLASTVTVQIGDPDGPEHIAITSVNPADQDHNQTWFKLDLADNFDLQPGQIVTVFDATTTKQTTVTHSTITEVDPATDTVTGDAGPDIVNVVLWACDDNGCGARYEDVNPDGSWSVNFALPGEQGWEDGLVDIQPGTTGGIYQGDADGDGTTYQRWQTAPNQPPVITALAAPLNPVQLGESINATVTFSDPDVGDMHNFDWIWGDGSTTDDGLSPSASHLYTQPGVYTITVMVTDAASASASFTSQQYVVIYDPDGGFVTGGGWITSPAGAYAPDSTLTGKATFGFVSKYKRGANVPTGDTEFQFKVADLNFKSTSYQWLVIAGSKAQFKGLGSINGAGEYAFMLSGIDGSPDRFRIKIWDKASGEVIYDNMHGASDDAGPTTALGGGSIVIHR